MKSNTDGYSIRSLLEIFISKGIISIDDVLRASSEVDLMNSIIKEIHPYKITRTTDGRYCTYVADIKKPQNRRQIRRKKEHDLYHELLVFYGLKNVTNKPKMPYEELFAEWITYKKKFIGVCNRKKGLSPSTIRRYERDFEKCFASSMLSKMPIGSITAVTLEEQIIKIIRKFDLPERAASNMIGYIRQSFQYAVRAGYLTSDPTDSMDRQLLLSQCPYVPPKEDKLRVMTIEELFRLRRTTQIHRQKYPDFIADYAIELAILTGMRVGEIAALKWSCIDDIYIHIDLSEHRLDYSDKPSELAIGEPKNGKHRLIPLTTDIQALFEIVKQLNHPSPEGYVFTKPDGTRCTGHSISSAASRRGQEAGLQNISIHRIRRTVSSILRNTLPIKAVANMLGHLEQTNEAFYNYDVTELQQKKNALEQLAEKILPFPEQEVPTDHIVGLR